MKRQITTLSKKLIPFPIRIALRKLNWEIRYAIQSKGIKEKPVYCPIANKAFKTFIDLNGQQISPTNGARSRQRLVWHFLVHQLNLLKEKRKILHIAPELSYMKILKNASNIDYHPGDKMANGYSNQKAVETLDLTDLDRPSELFDLIICNHVLEHIIDDREAMAEMFRVLKKDGIALITVPIKRDLKETYEDKSILLPKDREKHFGQWDHVRIYSPDIKYRLEEVGFEVNLINYANNFSDIEQKKFGFADEIIILAKK